MKNRLFFVLLLLSVWYASNAQVRLNVNGDARIAGHLLFQKSPTDSSIFIGSHAGLLDQGNNYNVFVGGRAGSTNTTGGGNIFLGQRAGRSNLNGSGNVFLGFNAGEANEGGYYNTFIGLHSGRSNVSGTENIFIGEAAGKASVSGHNNIFLGSVSGLQNIDGSSNVFLGRAAGYSNISGNENTFVGYLSGTYISRGTRNTYLGHLAGGTLELDSIDRAIAIGHNATVDCSNCAVIGGTDEDAVNLGIGTQSPAGALHILKKGNPPAGLSTAQNGLLMGIESTSGYKWIQSYGGDLILNLQGNDVGIGTAVVDYRLEVNGTAGKPGGGDWTNSASDRRLKRNIRPYTDGLEKLLKIRPVWYQYNSRSKFPSEQEFVGIIAQDMQEIAPYTVGSFQSEGQEYLNFDGSALRYMIINSIKELHDELAEKEEQLNKLEAQNTELQERLNSLENRFEHWLDQQTPDEDTGANSYTLPLERTAMLLPNQPNPFSEKTLVRFRLPESVEAASIQVTSAGGSILGSVRIHEPGKGELTIDTGNYPSGTYYYSLIVNGKVVDTKPMVKK